jgi:peptidyl-dipeptidase Dcp
MLRLRMLAVATAFVLFACAQAALSAPPPATTAASVHATTAMTHNPFFAASTLPFQAPPFDKIKDADYQPAIEEGMRQHLAEIEQIANNPAPATFANTFVAMEKSGAMLTRATHTFDAITAANTNPMLQKVQETEAPLLAAHKDAIYLNSQLFARVQKVYAERATLKLDPESLRLVEVTYRNFVHAGARLSVADKARLKTLNKEESTLSTQFTNKLLAATKAGALVVDDQAKLAGLSAGEIASAAQAAKDRGLTGKWVLPLQNTTQQPQ